MTFTPSPLTVASARTARLVREARTPVYSTDTVSAQGKSEGDLLDAAEEFAGPDFCHVCGRCTDHRGEHDREQLLAFAKSGKFSWLVGE